MGCRWLDNGQDPLNILKVDAFLMSIGNEFHILGPWNNILFSLFMDRDVFNVIKQDRAGIKRHACSIKGLTS